MDAGVFSEILESHLAKEKKTITHLQAEIFASGFVCGVAFSYTGIMGFIFGILTGLYMSRLSGVETIQSNCATYMTNVWRVWKGRLHVE